MCSSDLQQIYGTDIDADAIEIAKLRFWLSIAVDEDTPSPLPNLDFKFMQGNALIESINGIEIIPSDLNAPQHQKNLLGRDENASLFDKSQTHKLEALFLQYYEPNAQKAQLKAEILAIMKEAFDERIKQIDENIQSIKANPAIKPKERVKQQEKILQYESFKHDLDALLKDYEEHNFHTDKLFLYRFFFAPIFAQGGFDIIIGNPPYIDYRSIDENTKISLQKNSFVYTNSKRGSIFVYFIEKAAKLIHKQGYCIFINPINYICQDSGAGIREFIDNNLCLISMIDVSSFKVFNSASTYTCINCFTHKSQELKEINFGRANCEEELNNIALEKFPQSKIENLSILLDSITTKIFKANYPQLSSFCDIFCALSIAGFRNDVKNKKTKDNVPFLESSDIQKYDYKQGKFLHNAVSYYSTEKIKIFEDSEIIFMARMTNFIRCCIAPKAYFGGKVNILHNFKLDRKFILGVLNSKLINYFYAKKYFASHMQGGAFGFDTLSVGSLPIPKITKANQRIVNEIVALVDKILESKAKDSTASTKKLESQIDFLVYKLYSLTDEEIKIIEST